MKNSHTITIAVVALLVLMLFVILYNFNSSYEDENNKIIDNEKYEKTEQEIARKYITENDVVLELGARYGTVSCEINKKLKNKKAHVAVEPDDDVIDSLIKNRDVNNCEFHILHGVISNSPLKLFKIRKELELDPAVRNEKDYSASTVERNDINLEGVNSKTYTLKEVTEMFDLKFNVLVVDCEGCLEKFYNENKDFFRDLRMITYEKDQADVCDYNVIEKALLEYGFIKQVEGFHEVWDKI
jgi:FkbM family methyltransferase